MTRSEGDVHCQSVPESPDEHISDEEAPYEDQSIEEQLLSIELKQVQRELSHSKQDAATARATASAISDDLQTERDSMQKELRELKAEVESLNCSLETQSKRLSVAVRENAKLQAELLRKCKHDTDRSSYSPGSVDCMSQSPNGASNEQHNNGAYSPNASEAAVWQALQMAREDAAQSAARTAEAVVMVNTLDTQLKLARDEQHSALHDVAAAVGMNVEDDSDHLSYSVVSRVQELKSDLSSMEHELQSSQMKLLEEQALSLQLREDVLRERRALDAALASVAAKQSQLDHLTSQCRIKESQSAARHGHEVLLPLSESPDLGRSPVQAWSSDVAAIVSQWRCVSMHHVSEAHGLAEQLAAERKALQSMRAQALMLERQVETAEDQLETERNSYADRESSLRAQLDNVEAQVEEQERLLGLKGSAVAEAEAQAESTSAELVRTKERVRVLEDMVKAAEVELQSAICQMSNMQDMVVSTDAKLVEAQDAMVDRNDAIPGIKRIIASLGGLSGVKPEGVELFSCLAAKPATEEAERLIVVVEQAVSEKEAALEGQFARCHALQRDVVALENQISKYQENTASQDHAAAAQRARMQELINERDNLASQLQSKCKDLQQVEKQLQDASDVAKQHAEQVLVFEKTLAESRLEAQRVTSDLHHVSGQLEACSDEASSLRNQVKAANEVQVNLSRKLAKSTDELANARAQAQASVESQAASQREADSARSRVQGLQMRLEASEARINSTQAQLEKRNQEVRELNSMLKAWEAMRLSKDAQIAALMERCKRYDEDIAEKGRSNEALRRKLMHHHGSGLSRGSNINDSAPQRLSTSKAHSLAASVAGSLSGSEASRSRHIHLHMHGTGPPAGESLGPSHSARFHVQQPSEGPGSDSHRELLSQRFASGGQY